MSKRTFELSKANMEKEGLQLETLLRDRKWYMVDLSKEDEEIEYVLSTPVAVTEMLSGRVWHHKRSNGMVSHFRFNNKQVNLQDRVLQ